MASEVTGSKSQPILPDFANALATKRVEKGNTLSQRKNGDQDFLRALDRVNAPAEDKGIRSSGRKPSSPSKAEVPKAQMQKSMSQPKEAASHRGGGENSRKELKISEEDKTNSEEKPLSKERASSLKKLAKNDMEGIQEAPMIAFLSGHLEKIKPSEIPGLVTESLFVQSALNMQDIEQFMQQPKTLLELFAELDLPPNLMQEAVSSGIDLNQKMTPESFFKEIGIDPQRIAVELQILRGNLTTGGLTGYMQRAQVIGTGDQQERSTEVSASANGLEPKTNAVQSFHKLNNVGESVDDARYLEFSAGAQDQKISDSKFGVEHVKNPLGQQVDAKIDISDRMSLSQDEDECLGLAATVSGQDFLLHLGYLREASGVVPESVENKNTSSFLVSSVPSDQGPVFADQISQISQEKLAERPTINRGTFDSWRSMGDLLKGLDTKTVQQSNLDQPSEIPVHLAMLDNLTVRTFDSLNSTSSGEEAPTIAISRQDLMSAILHASDSYNPILSGEGTPLAKQATPGSLDYSAMNQVQDTLLSPQIGKGSLTPRRSFPLTEQPDGFFLEGGEKILRSDRDFFGFASRGNLGEVMASQQEDLGKSDKDGEMAEKFDEKTGDLLSLGLQTKDSVSPGFVADIVGSSVSGPQVDSPLSPAQRAHLVQQVMNRAAALVQQGGGMMRLDLTSADLGRMELAVSMDDDLVHLRVVTGHDGVRSALLADLMKLREALGQQNIQLGQVEVGLAGQQLGGGGQGPSDQRGFDQRGAFSKDEIMSSLRGLNTSQAMSPNSLDTAAKALDQVQSSSPLSHGRIAVRI